MTDLSFIIPAFNEERFIRQTIISILENIPINKSYEIILVDHGSTDGTPNIAMSEGAVIIDGSNCKTVACLRNLGVSESKGEILVFLDADTTITSQWKNTFNNISNTLFTNQKLITGSKLEIPLNSNWVSEMWYRAKRTSFKPTHIGSGHMIMSKDLFTLIGGFDEKRETGEDYDLCSRAKKIGADIIANPDLKAIHHGIPSSLKEFFHLEIWHGKGDWKDLHSILTSNIALISMIFLISHIILFVSSLYRINYFIPIFSLAMIAMICIASSLKKYHHEPLIIILANSLLFYLYYWARSFSPLSLMIQKSGKKRSRHN